MKKILLLLTGILFLNFAHLVKADEGWVIDNFQSDLNIQTDGKVAVIENIDVDFGSLQKHGIYRDIPYTYYTENNNNIYTNIKLESVTQNGTTTPVRQSQQGNYIRLQIGDANHTISGKINYRIKYLATGILRSFDNHDELYWDVTGNGWMVPITKTSAIVTIPQNMITGTLCFAGVQGSKEKCSSQVLSQNQASFQSSRTLNSSESMTIVLGYTKGMVPILTVTPPPSSNSSYHYTSSDPSYPPNLLVFLITTLSGIGFIIWLWKRNGQESLNHEAIVVGYSAPENLRPAEVGTLFDERADTLDVSATIVDLAAKGFLTITEKEKKWTFGSTDYILTKKDQATDSLLDYEKTLLDRMFKAKSEIKLSELEDEFYDDLIDIKKKLYQDILSKKYFLGNPEKVKTRYSAYGMVIVTLGIILTPVGYFTSGFLSAVGMASFIIGIIFIIFARFMPKRTALGHQTFLKILGFKMFIDKAEKYRQQFFERQNIFNEILPYTIVFGDTEKFAQAFKDLGLKLPEPTWYVSSKPFNPVLFSSNINSFSNSLTSAIASQPRSNSFASSGSGFSGGSSGGGFGGGGGGSW